MASDRQASQKKAFILDSTAFYAGIPFAGGETSYTTSKVILETRHRRISKHALKSLIDSSRLVIIDPSESGLDLVRDAASRSGDISKLSDTDISVVALALQLSETGVEPIIVSDDYSIQNLSKIFGIKLSTVMTKGITRTVKWIKYCKGCGKRFTGRSVRVCDVCGTELKMKFSEQH